MSEIEANDNQKNLKIIYKNLQGAKEKGKKGIAIDIDSPMLNPQVVAYLRAEGFTVETPSETLGTLVFIE